VGLVPEKFGFSAVKEWHDEPSFGDGSLNVSNLSDIE
jgi:hypothetical protein